MEKNYFVLAVIGAGILFTGAFAGYSFGRRGGVVCETEKAMIREEADAFRARIEAAFPEPQQVFDLTGTITAADGNKLTLETLLLRMIPPAIGEPTTEERDIIVGADTEVIKIEYGTSPDGGAGEQTKISASDLAVGDFITARFQENVKNGDGFTAYRIELMATPPNLNDDD